ncbi:hypothetical protein V8C44DRAFT_323442 [Trichoderma aethiopicum]
MEPSRELEVRPPGSSESSSGSRQASQRTSAIDDGGMQGFAGLLTSRGPAGDCDGAPDGSKSLLTSRHRYEYLIASYYRWRSREMSS